MAKTKKEILLQIGDVDNKMLAFCNAKPQIHPERLTVNELKQLLKAFETIYDLFEKVLIFRIKREKENKL